MSLSGLTRSLPRSLSRSFTTTSLCKNSTTTTSHPPRRKGRTPRVNPKTQTLLPPPKMRALVSLYHQSDDFITADNLLDRIDAAFIGSPSERQQSMNQIPHHTYDHILKDQRSAPRVCPWNLETLSTPPMLYNELGSWSGTVVGRERQIIDALYGVESGSLPGYETLVEARELKQKQRTE